jgi:hypothetical protein
VDGGLLKSTTNEMAIDIEKHRITLKSNGHKLKFRFQVVGVCDSMVNRTRNWSTREELRYQIKDEKKQHAFEDKTDPLLATLCFPEFVVRAGEIRKSLE